MHRQVGGSASVALTRQVVVERVAQELGRLTATVAVVHSDEDATGANLHLPHQHQGVEDVTP